MTVPIGLLPTMMESEVIDGPRHVALGQHHRPARAGRDDRIGARTGRRRCGPPLLDAAMPEQFLNMQREDYLQIGRHASAPAATGIERGLRSRYTQPAYALLGIAGARARDRRAPTCARSSSRAPNRGGRSWRSGWRSASSAWRVIRELGAEGAWLGTGRGDRRAGLCRRRERRDHPASCCATTSSERRCNASPDATVIAVAASSRASAWPIAATIAAALERARGTAACRRAASRTRGAIVASRTDAGRRADRGVDRDAGARVAARRAASTRSPPSTQG